MNKFISALDFSGLEITRNKLLTLFLLALMVRLALFMVVTPWENKISRTRIVSEDSLEYEDVAFGLINHHRFVRNSEPNIPEIWRTPGYPIFLAIIYKVFGFRRDVVVLFQIVLGALCCLLICKTGELLFSPLIGLLAGYLLAFDYLSIIVTHFILTEILFVFTFLLFLYLFCIWLHNGNIKWLASATIALEISTLIRPVSLYLPLLLGVGLATGWLSRGKTLKKRLVDSLILITMSLLVISPWLIRNQFLFGTPIVTTVQGYNLLYCNANYLEGAITGDDFFVIRNRYIKKLEQQVGWQDLSAVDKSKQMQELALSKIAKHPLQYAILHLRGTLPLFVNPGKNLVCLLLGIEGGWIGRQHQLQSVTTFLAKQVWPSLKDILHHPNLFVRVTILLGIVYLGGIYLAAIWGIVVLAKKDKSSALFLILTVLFYFIIISSPNSSVRFRVPIMPLLFLLSSVGIGTWHENRKAQGKKQ